MQFNKLLAFVCTVFSFYCFSMEEKFQRPPPTVPGYQEPTAPWLQVPIYGTGDTQFHVQPKNSLYYRHKSKAGKKKKKKQDPIAQAAQLQGNTQSLEQYLTLAPYHYATIIGMITGNNTQYSIDTNLDSLFLNEEKIKNHIMAYRKLKPATSLTMSYLYSKRTYQNRISAFYSVIQQSALTKSHAKGWADGILLVKSLMEASTPPPKKDDDPQTRAIKEGNRLKSEKRKKQILKEYDKITDEERNDAGKEVTALVNANPYIAHELAKNISGVILDKEQTVQKWQKNKTRNMVIAGCLALGGLAAFQLFSYSKYYEWVYPYSVGYDLNGQFSDSSFNWWAKAGSVAAGLWGTGWLLNEAFYTKQWYENKFTQLDAIKEKTKQKLDAAFAIKSTQTTQEYSSDEED